LAQSGQAILYFASDGTVLNRVPSGPFGRLGAVSDKLSQIKARAVFRSSVDQKSVTMLRKLMRIFALIELSKVTVLPGIGKFCSKNLSANSKMQQMVLARIVRVRVIKDSISSNVTPNA